MKLVRVYNIEKWSYVLSTKKLLYLLIFIFIIGCSGSDSSGDKTVDDTPPVDDQFVTYTISGSSAAVDMPATSDLQINGDMSVLGGDVDQVKVHFNEEGVYRFEIDMLVQGATVGIYDTEGNLIADSFPVDLSINKNHDLVVKITQGSYWTTGYDYVINILHGDPSTYHQGSSISPVNIPVNSLTPFSGSLGSITDDTVSYYSIDIPSVGVYDIIADNLSQSADIKIDLYNDQFVTIWSSADSNPSDLNGEMLTHQFTSAGTYYFSTTNAGSNNTFYDLTVKQQYHDGSLDVPVELTLGTVAFNGTVGYRSGDKVSYYSINIASPGTYRIKISNLSSESSSVNITIDTFEDKFITLSDSTNISGFFNETIILNFTSSCTFYFSITNNDSESVGKVTYDVTAEKLYSYLEEIVDPVKYVDLSRLFGSSVSISGDYAIVGAGREDGGVGNTIDNSGAAYIYEKDISGNWNEVDLLNASDIEADSYFGNSVSIDGSYAIVGASSKESVYIFEKDVIGNWNEVEILHASDADNYDRFGKSVSISGNYAIVGAYGEDGGAGNPIIDSGSAYLFERDVSGNWSEVEILRASDSAFSDSFGISVSINGNYAIVGAYGENDDRGSAYIFERDVSGNWNEVAILHASDRDIDDYFGIAVSINGNYAIVGASYEDGGAGDPRSNSGAAYIFERDVSSNWNEVAILHGSDCFLNDSFGSSVSVSNDIAVVGSLNEAAYIFERDVSGNWNEVEKIFATDGGYNDYFGKTVSIDNGNIVVGASGKDWSTGGVYFYTPQ